MEPSIPVSISISIANERRILLGPIILREKSPVRARRELERRSRKKNKQRREKKKEGEKGVERCRGKRTREIGEMRNRGRGLLTTNALMVAAVP